LNLLERLAQWPSVSGANWLKGDLAGKCRLRTGDYRVVFVVRGDTVIVETIDNRKDVYK
jgi:mRNA-degrading endonuclease RelE of RelBE toxin-antitoxin system